MELERKAAFRWLGLKPRPKPWLSKHGVKPVRVERNRRGPSTCFYSLPTIIDALRLEHEQWPPSKRWDFECRILGLNSGYHLKLLAEACRPDYELFRAAFFLSLKPASNFLLAFHSFGSPVGKDLLTRLARYVVRKVQTRLPRLDPDDYEDYEDCEDYEARLVRSEAELYRNVELSKVWISVKEDMVHWPKWAALHQIQIYNGAILLHGTANKNFIARKPAYIDEFESQSGTEEHSYPLELFETGLKPLPIQIHQIPNIHVILEHAGKIQYDGGQPGKFEANKSDLSMLTNHIEIAGKLDPDKFRATLGRILKAWNYRVNWESEMFQRGHRVTYEPNMQSLEKCEQTSRLMPKDNASRILGEKTRKMNFKERSEEQPKSLKSNPL